MGCFDSAAFRVMINAKEKTLSSAAASSYVSPITQSLYESESQLLGV
ncbi:hypothetical protein UUU_27640 [Klebsiella pneumoniae subsp. pneumoniae DSM 30104 = JCM 1662 = NBRC 14940]|nr:hypothetical protein UUU_27640 [Klebsiella pneumoniae subsp. pneumoniae DSM 30104 = JCM 1662 = NBRC 14940]